MDLDEVLREVEILDKESKALKLDLIKMCWYMRGSVTLDDAYSMSIEERNLTGELIKENLETAKKTGLPFF